MANFEPIHPGNAVCRGNVSHVLLGLRNSTLPAQEWTHGAHLCAAAALLKEVGLEHAEEEMPGLIQRYNVATGGENTETAGYHHTITIFYLRVIYHEIRSRISDPLDALANEILMSDMADKALPLRYYSKEKLFSVAARKTWVEPDLQSL